MPNVVSLLRGVNTLLSPVLPTLAGAVAARLFTSPRRHQPPARELADERHGERIRIHSDYHPGALSALRFGRGPRKLLAIHGWEGRASQWGALARRLPADEFTLIALDAPGHGASPGERAHPVAFANALLDADADIGPFDAVVAHSMGVPSTALALSRGLRAEHVVLIAGPSNAADVLHRFARMLGLSPAAKQAFEARVASIIGLPAHMVSIHELGPQIEQPALIIHSKDDREIPFADAEQLARHWPHARLVALDGFGHRRIIRDAGVLTTIAAELTCASQTGAAA